MDRKLFFYSECSVLYEIMHDYRLYGMVWLALNTIKYCFVSARSVKMLRSLWFNLVALRSLPGLTVIKAQVDLCSAVMEWMSFFYLT